MYAHFAQTAHFAPFTRVARFTQIGMNIEMCDLHKTLFKLNKQFTQYSIFCRMLDVPFTQNPFFFFNGMCDLQSFLI